MAGPWERYAATAENLSSGPWSKYGAKELPPQDPLITKLQEPGAAQRILRGVPGLGGALDEIGAAGDAAVKFLTGGRSGEDYDTALERRRQAIRKSDAENPIRNTLEAIGGGIATAAALPMARVFSNPVAPTVATSAADAGLNAAIYGGLAGFTEGEGGLTNRLSNASGMAQYGALFGLGLGGAGQYLANRAAATPVQSVTQSADDIGIRIPQFMEGGRASQNIAGKLGAIPFVGDDINNAVARTRTQTGNAAQNISDNLAGGRVTPQGAGEAVRNATTEAAGPRSAAVTDRVYQAVDQHMQGVVAPLSATRRAAAALEQESIAAASPLHAVALNNVQEALGRPNGLSFDGLSRLRTQIGRMIDNSIDPANATARSGLQRIYGALTDDMQTAIQTQGGAQAQRAWQRANTVARQVAERRDTVAKLIGAEGDKAGEGIVDRLVAMASSKSSADAARLSQARRAAGADSWRQLAASAIQRLGRNQSNDFSPDIFLKNYSQLSDAGRQSLFNSTGDNLIPHLDNLSQVAAALQQFNRLGNPSGSGGVGALLTALVGVGAGDAGATAATMLAGRSVGYLMSRPAVVRQASRHARTLERVMRRGQGRAALTASAAALARVVSDETGEDAKAIELRILNAQ